jgi:hypothetical protein
MHPPLPKVAEPNLAIALGRRRQQGKCATLQFGEAREAFVGRQRKRVSGRSLGRSVLFGAAQGIGSVFPNSSVGNCRSSVLRVYDGIHDWTDRGAAYDPREAIVRYPDGTVNHWNKAERPSVYIENGHVTAVTMAVIDVEKEQEKGNDGHGSKVIVIPFDGAALDRDLQSPADSLKL